MYIIYTYVKKPDYYAWHCKPHVADTSQQTDEDIVMSETSRHAAVGNFNTTLWLTFCACRSFDNVESSLNGWYSD
jgi:hypothetical protein